MCLIYPYKILYFNFSPLNLSLLYLFMHSFIILLFLISFLKINFAFANSLYLLFFCWDFPRLASGSPFELAPVSFGRVIMCWALDDVLIQDLWGSSCALPESGYLIKEYWFYSRKKTRHACLVCSLLWVSVLLRPLGRAVVLNRLAWCSPQGTYGNVWKYMVITTEEMLLSFSGQRLRMLINTLQCTGQPFPTTKICLP